MSLLKLIMTMLLSALLPLQASESLILRSVTGETLMIHQLNNGEVWGSLMITDQVADSFAAYELIVLQIDHNKPIKLDQEKRCGTPAGEQQLVAYHFETEQKLEQWQFSQTTQAKSDFLKVTGWDQELYHHMKSDRRPEVVDFPIQASIALVSLWQQFEQGERVVFRYVTDADEAREAVFNIANIRAELAALF